MHRRFLVGGGASSPAGSCGLRGKPCRSLSSSGSGSQTLVSHAGPAGGPPRASQNLKSTPQNLQKDDFQVQGLP